MIGSDTNGRCGLLFPKPARVEELARHRARLTFQPLERGLGATLGASLRRVLLSSLRGSATTEVTLPEAVHEQGILDGVDVDVLQLMLNLKGVVFRMPDREEATATLHMERAGPVLAGDILAPNGVQVVNPEHVIARLSPGGRLDLQIRVETGRGYRPGRLRRHPGEDLVWGPTVRLDASFSPVRRADYAVEHAREGQRSELDRLVLHIETDGSISPADALREGAQLLRDPLNPFAGATEVTPGVPSDGARESLAREHERAGLMLSIEELALSVRSSNCLKAQNVNRVGDLVQRTETELLRTPNLGRRSLNEIREALAERGLTLGMAVPGWPPARGGRGH
ncbi:MAG: DNA-directed RNA polymerase subunit alpha [Burkholderiaceae bacterium]|nr:DNA-directed RNA polymerase subunit alpha [Burkholderiaceae bacterium]